MSVPKASSAAKLNVAPVSFVILSPNKNFCAFSIFVGSDNSSPPDKYKSDTFLIAPLFKFFDAQAF